MTFEPGNEGRLGRDGVERRERLLAELRPVVARRGRRRRVLAVGAASVLAMAAGVGIAQLWSSGQVVTPREQVAVVPQVGATEASTPRPKAPQEAPTAVEYVVTSAGIAERVDTRTLPVEAASDEDLMAALREAGQDPGLVRVDGRVVVAGDLGRKAAP